MNYEILGQDIIYFKNIFDNLPQLLEKLKSLEWETWRRANGAVIGTMTLIEQDKDCFNDLYIPTKNAWEKYKELVDVKKDVYFQNTRQCVRKWNDNQDGMGPHKDTSYGEDGSTTRPEYTMCYYLTDNYVGGKLEIPEYNLSFEPEKGSAIIFPSDCYHGVTNFISGERIMAVLFAFKIDAFEMNE